MLPNPLGKHVINCGIAWGVISTVAVSLRFLARSKCKARLAADDFVLALALGPLWGMVVCGILAVKIGGMGLPRNELDHWQISTFLQFMLATIGTYVFTATMVKISLLILYRRVFATSAFHKKAAIVGCLCLAWFFVILFMDIFQCHPITDTFKSPRPSTCIDIQAFLQAMIASNLVLDVIVLCLPLHMVWKLDLPWSDKIVLFGIFSLGGLTCSASGVRIAKIGVFTEEDVMVTLPAQYIWSQIEIGTSILCACIITYRPLVTSLLSKVSGKYKTTKSSSQGVGRSPRDTQVETERSYYLQHLAEQSPRKINRFYDLNTLEYSAGTLEEGNASQQHENTECPRSVEVLGAPPGMSPYSINV